MVSPVRAALASRSPKPMRGFLLTGRRCLGFYQLFIVTGTMISFWFGARLFLLAGCQLTRTFRINYGIPGHFTGAAVYQVPLSLQAVPAV